MKEKTVAELLAGYASTLAELRRRGVVRSNNAPAGDYAEWLCHRALGGTLVDNFSVKSYDLTDANGDRIQVKARVVSEPRLRGQLQTSPFRSWDFKFAALVLLSLTDYKVVKAVLLPKDVVKEKARPVPHVKGHALMMTQDVMDHPLAEDITERLRRAAEEDLG